MKETVFFVGFVLAFLLVFNRARKWSYEQEGEGKPLVVVMILVLALILLVRFVSPDLTLNFQEWLQLWQQ